MPINDMYSIGTKKRSQSGNNCGILPSQMDIILFFQSTTRRSWHQKLSGVHRFAQGRNWFVQVVERFATPAEIRRAMKTWSPVGCLVDRAMSGGNAPDSVFKDVPTVYLDQDPRRRSRMHPCILHDSAASAALAGAELLKMRCRSYAYIGMEREVHWDRPRRERFKADVRKAGLPFVLLPRTGLKEAIAALPKPCGILGANDYCAMEAYYAATKAGLMIPDEVAIAGIDNDEHFCEVVSPGLTSVEPDFEGAGFRLAQMLAEEIDRKDSARPANLPRRAGPAVRTEHYGPLRIVRRGSTAAAKGQSPAVRRALEYIHRHACEALIRLDDVIAEMGCSRRLATIRFKKEVGRTMLEEIHEHRIQRACELLVGGHMPIATVVAQCGYRSDGFAKKLFRAHTGMTMREYRSKQKQQKTGEHGK